MQDAAQDLGVPSAVDQPDAAAHAADADAMPAEVPERDAPTDSYIALPARTASAAPCDATPEAAEVDVDSAHAAQMPQTLQAPVPAARTPDAARELPSRAAPAAKMGAEEQSKAAGERADADEVPATTAAGAADGQDTACPAPGDAVLETQPFVSYDIGAAEALETENSVAHPEDAENAAPVQASSAEAEPAAVADDMDAPDCAPASMAMAPASPGEVHAVAGGVRAPLSPLKPAKPPSAARTPVADTSGALQATPGSATAVASQGRKRARTKAARLSQSLASEGSGHLSEQCGSPGRHLSHSVGAAQLHGDSPALPSPWKGSGDERLPQGAKGSRRSRTKAGRLSQASRGAA